MSTLKARLDQANRNIETIDTFLIDALSRLATWLAPLVPAAMVYHAAQLYISDVGPVQALVAAASIELLGLQVTSNWLTAGEYNRRTGVDGETLPMRRYVAMLAAYILTVLCVVVGLKVAPETVSWLAIVMLSMLTLLSATAFVQRRQLSALIDHQSAILDAKQIAELRSIRRAARNQIGESARKSDHSEPNIEHANAARLNKMEQRQEQLIEVLRTQGPLSTGDLANALDLSPNTVRSYLSSCNGQIAGDGRTGWRLSE